MSDMTERCDSKSWLDGINVRCDLDAGHRDDHELRNRSDGWLVKSWPSTTPERTDPAWLDEACASCGESPLNECPKSKRRCGHHCNHSWTHGGCDWCGKEYEEGEPESATDPAWLDEAVEAGARAMWREEHGRISSHDSVRTRESDERESAEDGFRQWDRGIVGSAVKNGCRRRMRSAILAALPAIREGIAGAIEDRPSTGVGESYVWPWQRSAYLEGLRVGRDVSKRIARAFGSDVSR